MIDIIQKLDEMVAGRRQVYPCHVNRASSLGYAVPEIGGCLRRGYYERANWQDKELPSVELQRIFDEGGAQEKAVLKDLAEAGVNVIEAQRAYDWPQYQITGHIDGKIIDEGNAIPLEIKSMNPNIFDRVHTFEDFKKYPWTRSYMVQIQLYMLMNNIDQAMFILKNKSSGAIRQINVALDYDLAEWTLKAAEAINKAVTDKTPPDRIACRETCAMCSFKTICLPEINWNEPLKIKDDPEYAKKLNRYAELENSEKEAGKLWDSIREAARATAEANGGKVNELVGDWHLTGEIKNGRFNLKTERV